MWPWVSQTPNCFYWNVYLIEIDGLLVRCFPDVVRMMTSALCKSNCMQECTLISLMSLLKPHSCTYTLSRTLGTTDHGILGTWNHKFWVLKSWDSSRPVESCYQHCTKNRLISARIYSVNMNNFQWNWTISQKFGQPQRRPYKLCTFYF